MRKFTFLRKKIQAKDRALQEKLVQNYFDDLELKQQPEAGADTGFDSRQVYNRIIDNIDAMPVELASASKKWMIAAAVFAVASVSTLAFYNRARVLDVVSPIVQKQFSTVNGQVASLTLVDGTKVWLNGGSKLSYPETFRGDKREITLTGEAFLDVAHDDNKAFIVHTGKIRTQVLGTSFNIKAYAEDAFVKVDVVTGKVGVVTAAAPTVFLTPQQEAKIDKKSHLATTVNGIDVSALSGWKDGDFIVKNMMLHEVLSAVKHRFNVLIKADGNLSKCSISANFTNVSLQNIMKIIAKLVKGKVTPDGADYLLKGKGC
jgi:transmembrane sensor